MFAAHDALARLFAFASHVSIIVTCACWELSTLFLSGGNPTLTSFRASPERQGQYNSATLTVGSYRQGHGHPESNPPSQRSSSKPRGLYSGSYHESRRPQVKAAHPYRRNYGPPYCHPAQASGYAEGLSSHPSGSRHSLDLMDNVVSRLPQVGVLHVLPEAGLQHGARR
ncbi:hypothetical protein C0Q70_05550 [Pomacea canaliculata]|uniref:Uncharacterized protein n=1 Tax=Pomacea canaliculata TaxID=400727 RepID=A0A2T7PLH4_POMCA|nr:hypothetical protein C0Q70_05550 [Pomacea canaliculata]